ncbi:hypothetical protein [Ferruginibacter sp. SUN106]|uniref:hypothetical protein n=1 Tax=Ferruginibacter sp. SUN106 TaxID=2978348 RepID=UPI003D36CB3F
MKVTVNKYLNARAEQASTNAACFFYKSPGDTIEIDDVLIGTEIDGNSIWYHCKDDGCFYWSGGIEEQEFEIPGKATASNKDLIAIINTIKNDRSFYLSKRVIGYKGIGVGLKNDSGSLPLCLVIFVIEKINLNQLDASNSVPTSISYKGFQIMTDVKPVKEPATHNFIQHQNHEELKPDINFNPIAIGASISNNTPNKPSSGYGTRTMRVKKNSKDYLLSCFHVLLYNRIFSAGDFTYNGSIDEQAVFPSPIKNTAFPRNRFTHPVVEGELNGFYDYGLVELQSPFEIANNFDGTAITEFVKRAEVDEYIDTQVTIIGATSYKQTGKITSIKAEIEVECRGFQRKYFDVLVSEKISMGGDSGAPVITTDNKLLGYVIAGNERDVSFILPFYYLFLNKGITI